jgi:hypothetical protein
MLLAVAALLAGFLMLSPAASADSWQHCPTPDMPGLLKVKVIGCPEGRSIVDTYAWKAQHRGARIRVLGYRCYAVNGYSPVRCRRGDKRVEYIGSVG